MTEFILPEIGSVINCIDAVNLDRLGIRFRPTSTCAGPIIQFVHRDLRCCRTSSEVERLGLRLGNTYQLNTERYNKIPDNTTSIQTYQFLGFAPIIAKFLTWKWIWSSERIEGYSRSTLSFLQIATDHVSSFQWESYGGQPGQYMDAIGLEDSFQRWFVDENFIQEMESAAQTLLEPKSLIQYVIIGRYNYLAELQRDSRRRAVELLQTLSRSILDTGKTLSC